MNAGIVHRFLGLLLMAEAAALAVCGLAGLWWKESAAIAFFVLALAIIAPAIFLTFGRKDDSKLEHRQGFALVVLGLALLTLVGAVPYVLIGGFSWVSALFEATASFTTTAVTVMGVDRSLPKSLLAWRAVSQWLGGLAFLALSMAFFQNFSFSGSQTLRLEAPIPKPGGMISRLKGTFRLALRIYFVFTLAIAVFLLLTGLDWQDSLGYAMAVVSTGGFTVNHGLTVPLTPLAEYLLVLFMLIAGGNYGLYHNVLQGRWQELWRDEEMRLYTGLFAAGALLIFSNLWLHGMEGLEAWRKAIVHAASMLTSTGLYTADINHWPDFSQVLMLFLMLVGGCSSSVGTGLKGIRLLVLFKMAYRELLKLIHPNAVIAVRFNGRIVPAEAISHVTGFVVLYVTIFVISTVLLTTQGLDLFSGASAAASALANGGPGLGMVGPGANYGQITDLAKIQLTLLMVLGRLEFYSVLILFSPWFYRR